MGAWGCELSPPQPRQGSAGGAGTAVQEAQAQRCRRPRHSRLLAVPGVGALPLQAPGLGPAVPWGRAAGAGQARGTARHCPTREGASGACVRAVLCIRVCK